MRIYLLAMLDVTGRRRDREETVKMRLTEEVDEDIKRKANENVNEERPLSIAHHHRVETLGGGRE